MPYFDARLRVVGEPGFPLGVEVDLTDDRMTVLIGPHPLAEWSLDEIDIASLPDGFHIKAEGEEVVLNVMDEKRFAKAVGLNRASPRSSRP